MLLNFVIRQLLKLLLLLTCSIGFSQDNSEKPFRANHYVYFNPGALLNIPSGLQIGYEQRVTDRIYLDVEGGILLYSKNPTLTDFNATNRKGFRFQAGGKFYFTDYFFIGPQFLYKKVTMNEKEWLFRLDNQYEQRFDTYRTRKTYAVAAELGWHYPFEKSPFSLEINYALGLQRLDVKYDPLPIDVSFDNLTEIGSAPGVSILPFFNYKIKLKYALGKNRK